MRKLKIYLDNCCYNRPYDDQTQPKVILETLAKLYIQELALNHQVDLVWSYALKYENSRNIGEAKRTAIAQWEKLSVAFVGKSEPLVALAHEVEKTGIKPFDALHSQTSFAPPALLRRGVIILSRWISVWQNIRTIELLYVTPWILLTGRLGMTNNAVLLDKGIKCLNESLGMLEAEQFIYVLKSQPFDYTEWRRTNLCPGMTLDEISNAADAYCRENP